jgi:arsenite methyltransferase
MNNSEELKTLVKEKYSQIATQTKEVNASSCCGGLSSCSGDTPTNIMNEDYSHLDGYTEEADLGLGCGLPTQFAQIQKGDTVLDLGSGAGNDCFVARHETGPEGKVIGVDFTPIMIQKARENVAKLGYNNIEFRLGDIEDMPVSDNSVDVIVSNCVLNLVPNKKKVFEEMFRVTRPGGHFSVSDIVLQGEIPEDLRESAEMYAGCVSGAIQKEEYLALIREAGFANLVLQKERAINLPDEILRQYLDEAALARFKRSELGIFSISVYAEKEGESRTVNKSASEDLSNSVSPEDKEEPCCEPGSGCC